MKKISGVVLALIACAVFAVGAWATDYRFRGLGAHYVAPAVYYPPLSIGPAGPDQTELVRELFQAYKAKAEEQEKFLKAMIASGAVPPTFQKAFAPEHPGLKVLNNACSSCHETATKEKGKGFAFLSGGAFVDEGDNMQRVLKAILPDPVTGKAFMPPPSRKSLSGEEGMLATGFLVTLPPSKVSPAPASLPK